MLARNTAQIGFFGINKSISWSEHMLVGFCVLIMVQSFRRSGMGVLHIGVLM